MSAEKAASTGNNLDIYIQERSNVDWADPSLCILVVRTLLFNLRTSPLVTEMLGEGVRPKPFLFGGEPWVHGTVSG